MQQQDWPADQKQFECISQGAYDGTYAPLFAAHIVGYVRLGLRSIYYPPVAMAATRMQPNTMGLGGTRWYQTGRRSAEVPPGYDQMGLTGIGRYELCLTTDQKVGGSSPSGRAREALAVQGLLSSNYEAVADSARKFWVVSWSSLRKMVPSANSCAT